MVIGSYNRLRTYAWNPRKSIWDELARKEIPNMYSVTALSWKKDGSNVVCGSLCGAVYLFESGTYHLSPTVPHIW